MLVCGVGGGLGLGLEDAGPAKKKPFSEDEKQFLISQMEAYKRVLLSRPGEPQARMKSQMWAIVTEALNHRFPGNHRTTVEVRKKWQNIVTSARREMREAELRGLSPDSFPWLWQKINELTAKTPRFRDPLLDVAANNGSGISLAEDWRSESPTHLDNALNFPIDVGTLERSEGNIGLKREAADDMGEEEEEEEEEEPDVKEEATATANSHQLKRLRLQSQPQPHPLLFQRGGDEGGAIPVSTAVAGVGAGSVIFPPLPGSAGGERWELERREREAALAHREAHWALLRRRLQHRNRILAAQAQRAELDLALHRARVHRDIQALTTTDQPLNNSN